MTRQINEAGLSLVKSFEGLFLNAYQDSVGVWTIGWGHTKGVHQGQTITQAQATQFLLDDMAEAEAAVERLVTVPLSGDQFAALVSFTFNLGAGALGGSTLLRKLNAGGYASVPTEMMRWDHAGGKTLAGLTRRRKAEGELFASGIAPTQPAPPQKPPDGDPVLRAAQAQLADLGYSAGTPDGLDGPKTQAALAKFKLNNPDLVSVLNLKGK